MKKAAIRYFSAAAFLLFLSLAAIAQMGQGGQGGKLRGDVADAAENAPIRYAFVLVHGGSGKGDVTAKLDEHGRFELPLTPGLYDIFVAAEGFTPSCKRVQISIDQTTTFKSRLKPDAEHLQSTSH
jgi:hypothetical protein